MDDSAAAPNTLADREALQRRIERRGDYLTEPGGASYNPPGYPEGMATYGKQRAFYREDAGGVMREMAPLTGADITGVNKNAGLGASEGGAFAVLTVDQMNDLGRSLNKKYGDSSFLNLGNMTPGAQAVAFSEIAERYPNQEYGRFDQRLGGQSIVRNMRLVGMNPKTGSVMLEGGNRASSVVVLPASLVLRLVRQSAKGFHWLARQTARRILRWTMTPALWWPWVWTLRVFRAVQSIKVCV